MPSKSAGGPPPQYDGQRQRGPFTMSWLPPLPPPPAQVQPQVHVSPTVNSPPRPIASLSVRGQLGEYRLEVSDAQGLQQLTQMMDRLSQVEAQLALTQIAQTAYQPIFPSVMPVPNLMMPEMLVPFTVAEPNKVGSASQSVARGSGHDAVLTSEGVGTAAASDLYSSSPQSQPAKYKPRLHGARVQTHDFHGKIKYTEYTTIQRLTDMTVHDFRWKDGTERVLEVGHPLCRQCFVTPILAGFFCDALQPLTRGNFQQCVWEEVYYLLNERLHADLFQVSERLANALELGRVVETSQKYAPNPEYYTRKRWFILEPEITIQATPFGDFLADQIRSTFPGDFHTLKEACFVLSKTMNSFPTLIEKFQKAEFIQLSHSADSTTTKFKGAVILHLDIPTFKTVGDAPQFPSVFTFAHNSSILTACAILRDGYIRPSAAAEHQAQWLPVPGFYSRGSMSNSDREEDVKRSLKETFRKAMAYSHFSDATRPTSIFGVAYSRQHQHCTIHAGGVCADHAASLFWDACHNASDRRWIFRSQLAQVKGIAVYI